MTNKTWTDCFFIELNLVCMNCNQSNRFLMNNALLCPVCGKYAIIGENARKRLIENNKKDKTQNPTF